MSEEKQVRREYTCTVTGFKMLTPTVFETTFEPKAADGDILPDFKPGQFISIIVPGAGPKGRDLRRAYSIASQPKTRPIELCIKLVEGGPGTNYLYKLRPGDTFRGVAPYGDFVYKTPPSRHACFISTGTGIAPFRSMVLSDVFKNNPPLSATLMLGVRDEAELMYMEELGALKGVRWVPCVSRPSTGKWTGFKGRVTDWLRAQGEDFPWRETEYYLCGGGAMIDEVKAIVTEKGIGKEQIHQEVYYKEPK